MTTRFLDKHPFCCVNRYVPVSLFGQMHQQVGRGSVSGGSAACFFVDPPGFCCRFSLPSPGRSRATESPTATTAPTNCATICRARAEVSAAPPPASSSAAFPASSSAMASRIVPTDPMRSIASPVPIRVSPRHSSNRRVFVSADSRAFPSVNKKKIETGRCSHRDYGRNLSHGAQTTKIRIGFGWNDFAFGKYEPVFDSVSTLDQQNQMHSGCFIGDWETLCVGNWCDPTDCSSFS